MRRWRQGLVALALLGLAPLLMAANVKNPGDQAFTFRLYLERGEPDTLGPVYAFGSKGVRIAMGWADGDSVQFYLEGSINPDGPWTSYVNGTYYGEESFGNYVKYLLQDNVTASVANGLGDAGDMILPYVRAIVIPRGIVSNDSIRIVYGRMSCVR